MEEKTDYQKTLSLPKTAFSMKANLREREPVIQKEWEAKDVFHKILKERENGPSYVLHDGPPYANGEIHIGHALNKVLKDIINKYWSMKGYRTPYVPGWDCHGLPIELQVVKEFEEKKKEYTRDILRKACRSYASKFIEKQMKGFKRLGIFGLWERPYMTMSKEFESGIIEAFGRLFEKGYIYRGLKPVHWCPSCETALAEAEVEYKDSTSPTVFVKFKVKNSPFKDSRLSKNTYVVIWTTTPWTLPANLAVCFHPKYRYLALKPVGKDEHWIMVNELAEPTFQKMGLKVEHSIELSRPELDALRCQHPFIDREVMPVFDEYVTLDTGTGIVHIAPGHGEEDYQIGQRYGLPVLSPVDSKGRFTEDFAMMKGVNVFEANPKIIEMMKKDGTLLLTEKLVHSYPHCWRCKNEVIFRATDQWFLRIDHEGLRKKAVEGVKSVRWIPAWGEERMLNMLEKRPDWCLSRQRAWGVPIPAFICKSCGESLMTTETINFFANITKEKNVDAWFTDPVESLMPPGTKCPKCGQASFDRGSDILDVWFDSGVSHLVVLNGKDGLTDPSDLYLEGSDQYRGWFQSSLWPAVALNGHPPYKNVLTHGFLLDEQGRAMHKSLGNTIAPSPIMDEFGADIIRLWVVSSDYKEDIALGKEILKRLTESYRMLRNTVRFLFSNLNGFDASKDRLPLAELKGIDLWALKKLLSMARRVDEAYANFEFNIIFHQLNGFCASEMSATYLNILKDRLYTAKRSSPEARGSRTVLLTILEYLAKIMAPILSFTAEEIWSNYKTELKLTGKDSIHQELMPELNVSVAGMDQAEQRWDRILAMAEPVRKALESLRAAKEIGDSLEAKILLAAKDPDTEKFLKENTTELEMGWIVSRVEVVDRSKITKPLAETPELLVLAGKADGKKCVRCWHYSQKVGTFKNHPELCERCHDAIS